MTSEARHKRGDVREDGMVFWSYNAGFLSGEYWLHETKFNEKHAKETSANRTWRRNNPERVRANNARWQEENADLVSIKHTIYCRERRAADPTFALAERLRNLVCTSLRRKGLRKNSKTEAMLGCTYSEFRAHLEAQFLPGMSWENRNLWHIDHIVPCKAGKTTEQIEALFHFSNLRPMWGPDNCSKNAKLPAEHELSVDLHPKVREIWQRAKDSACTK